MLVMPTKARMNVMYAFVRVSVSFVLNVVVGSPPPRIATRRMPFERTHARRTCDAR